MEEGGGIRQRRSFPSKPPRSSRLLTHHGHVPGSSGHVRSSSHVPPGGRHVSGGVHVLQQGDEGEAGEEEGLGPTEGGEEVEVENNLLG